MIAVLLLLLEAGRPAPTPTPGPTQTPVTASTYGGGRTLSDVARERRLAKEKGEAGKTGKGGVTVASGTAGAALPAGTPTPAAGDEAEVDGPKARLVIDSVAHNGIVGSGGQIAVFGKLRNNGHGSACDVALTIRIYDDKSQYLASTVVKLDEAVIAPNAFVSFSGWLQAPPGVAGSIRDKALGYGTTGPGATLEGKWRMLGDRVDAEVTTYSEKCLAPKGDRGEKADPRASPN